jgi:hypothetical protein
VKALSLWQPFATLIAAGAKTIETRSWGTSYRGPLVIHAAKKFDGDVQDDCRAVPDTLRRLGFAPAPGPAADAAALPWRDLLGRAVALCRLADCRRMDAAPDPLNDAFGTFGPGRWGWLLAEVVPLLPPVPLVGQRGLWDVPPGTFGPAPAAVTEGGAMTDLRSKPRGPVRVTGQGVECDWCGFGLRAGAPGCAGCLGARRLWDAERAGDSREGPANATGGVNPPGEPPGDAGGPGASRERGGAGAAGAAGPEESR